MVPDHQDDEAQWGVNHMDGGEQQGSGHFVLQRRKAALVLFSVTLIWGATFIWMKQLLNALETPLEVHGTVSVVAFLVGARFAMALALMLVTVPGSRRSLNDPAIQRGGLLLGGLMLVGFFSQMVALEDINPSTSAFLTSLYVVMTALITSRMDGHLPTRALLWGVMLATLGAGFIEGPPHVSWGVAELVTVLSALFFAFHIVATQHWTTEHDPLPLTLVSFAVVACGAFALTLITAASPLTLITDVLGQPGVWLPLVCLGVGGSFFCLLALNMYQRHLHPVHAAVLYTFEPVWATLFGLVLGLVPFTWWMVAGGGVLVLGNIVVELSATKAEDVGPGENPSKTEGVSSA